MNKKISNGFTVVELIVAMGLFVLLVSIATGSFIRALRTQRNLTHLISVNDNISLTLEQMSREIRTGFQFSSPSPSQLNFTNAHGIAVIYRLNAAAGLIEKKQGLEEFYTLTAANVKVEDLRFILKGHSPGDGFPPRITILITISPRIPIEIQSNFQTTVSARALDT